MWGAMIVLVCQLAMVLIILLSMTPFLENKNMMGLIKLFYTFVIIGFIGAVLGFLELIVAIIEFIF